MFLFVLGMKYVGRDISSHKVFRFFFENSVIILNRIVIVLNGVMICIHMSNCLYVSVVVAVVVVGEITLIIGAV